jgi:hypothetical protein
LFQGTLSELQDAHRAQLTLGVNQPEQAVHCLTAARKGRLMSMFCVLHAELLKLKRTLAFRMIFVLPLLVALLQFFALWRTRKSARTSSCGRRRQQSCRWSNRGVAGLS